MNAKDFSFNGRELSDYKFMICNFGNRDSEISNGSKIEFNTVSTRYGSYFLNAGASYSEALTIKFSVCKNPCYTRTGSLEPIVISESTSLMRWLNTKTMKYLKLYDEEYENINFQGSFTDIERVEYNGKLYGFNLTFTTNRPFGVGDAVTRHFSIGEGGSALLYDLSDEIGYIYPIIYIVIKQAGNLVLTFDGGEKTITEINNVEVNDNIYLEYPCIYQGAGESSNGHFKFIYENNKFTNNFNFVFPKISNSEGKRINNITSNLDIDLTIRYCPIRKVGA